MASGFLADVSQVVDPLGESNRHVAGIVLLALGLRGSLLPFRPLFGVRLIVNDHLLEGPARLRGGRDHVRLGLGRIRAVVVRGGLHIHLLAIHRAVQRGLHAVGLHRRHGGLDLLDEPRLVDLPLLGQRVSCCGAGVTVISL